MADSVRVFSGVMLDPATVKKFIHDGCLLGDDCVDPWQFIYDGYFNEYLVAKYPEEMEGLTFCYGHCCDLSVIKGYMVLKVGSTKSVLENKRIVYGSLTVPEPDEVKKMNAVKIAKILGCVDPEVKTYVMSL